MVSQKEFEQMQDEIRNMTKGELLHLSMQIEHIIRERRVKDVVFYFNNLAKQDTKTVNNHAVAAYNVICKELQGQRRGVVLDTQLDIVEVLIGLD